MSHNPHAVHALSSAQEFHLPGYDVLSIKAPNEVDGDTGEFHVFTLDGQVIDFIWQ